MKILLLGEFSGVHNNLKENLVELGHEVFLADASNSYRKFTKDISITPWSGRYMGRLLNIIFFFINIRKFIGYDVIQFINPYALPYYFYYVGVYHLLFRFNKRIVLYACGTDPAFIKSKRNFKYFPFDGSHPEEMPSFTQKRFKYLPYAYFIKKVHMIIPSSYTYAIGYCGNEKLQNPIPLPGAGNYVLNIKKTQGKIKILFGITRRGFKGANYILEALERIKKEYHDRVEVKIVERVPFSDYVKLLEDSDILIDQCKSYDYGMNAIFAMERGIVVLSGSEREAMEYLNIKQPAVINIIPDVDQIEGVLISLIGNKSLLDSVKGSSLNQVKSIHNPRIIAQQFINFYQSPN